MIAAAFDAGRVAAAVREILNAVGEDPARGSARNTATRRRRRAFQPGLLRVFLDHVAQDLGAGVVEPMRVFADEDEGSRQAAVTRSTIAARRREAWKFGVRSGVGSTEAPTGTATRREPGKKL